MSNQYTHIAHSWPSSPSWWRFEALRHYCRFSCASCCSYCDCQRQLNSLTSSTPLFSSYLFDCLNEKVPETLESFRKWEKSSSILCMEISLSLLWNTDFLLLAKLLKVKILSVLSIIIKLFISRYLLFSSLSCSACHRTMHFILSSAIWIEEFFCSHFFFTNFYLFISRITSRNWIAIFATYIKEKCLKTFKWKCCWTSNKIILNVKLKRMLKYSSKMKHAKESQQSYFQFQTLSSR